MDIPPGHEDKPHDHPKHYCYVLKGGKLCITGPDEAPHDVEMPSGACPIIPAGPHKVKNTGSENFQILFFEPNGKTGATVEKHVSPFEVDKDHYKPLSEDDDWVMGLMTMKAKSKDTPHSHRDHILYVMEGGKILIKDYGNTATGEEKAVELELPAGAAKHIPPSHHKLEITGDTDVKILFWESKK